MTTLRNWKRTKSHSNHIFEPEEHELSHGTRFKPEMSNFMRLHAFFETRRSIKFKVMPWEILKNLPFN
jgi:hypothetical protein